MQVIVASDIGGKALVTITFVKGTVTEFVRTGREQILQIGIGNESNVSTKDLRLLCRKMIHETKARKLERIAMVLSDLMKIQKNLSLRQVAEIVVTQSILAEYSFDIYKTDVKQKNRVKEFVLIGPRQVIPAVEKARVIGEEMNAARSLANTPGGAMTPSILADAAQYVAKAVGIKVSIFDRTRIEKLKMGALLGVSKGSSEEPRFIVLDYHGGKKTDAPIVLIGKGVTFDSGGINLKPTGGLDDMHMDMSGAAIVIHAVLAVAKLKLKKNVVALLPAAENMVSGSSYRPGDILRSMSGVTIEVTNTDAEGRVILADALTYAKRYKPKAVIDIATLTGASMVALGQRANAVFSDNPRLVRIAFEASEATGEPIWQLPLWDVYADDNKATFGDIANSAKTRYGGAITGALFLKHFAQGYPWMHIDMAPRMVSIDGEYLAKGSSGEPMQLLVQMLQKL